MSFAGLVAQADRTAQAHLGGEPVIYRSAFAEPIEVVGIFDAQYVLTAGTTEGGVETIGPAVFLRLVDLPAEPEQDEPTLVIRGLEYRVVERKPDSMGGIVLVLRLVIRVVSDRR